MRILLSNDDGCHAPGLQCLREGLMTLGEVSVVAPDRDRSGASNSLTLREPLRVRDEGDGVYCVAGTPTDCVHLAITGMFGDLPDLVVSGVNAGANLGDDVLYSGTVAAAMEGRFLGLPAIAVSTTAESPAHYETAVEVTIRLIRMLESHPLPAATLLNINVPDVPSADLAGIEVTRLGSRHIAEPVIPDEDPEGNPIFWIGPAGAEQDAGPGTDFHAIRERRASVTPLSTDLTRHDAIDALSGWIGASQ